MWFTFLIPFCECLLVVFVVVVVHSLPCCATPLSSMALSFPTRPLPLPRATRQTSECHPSTSSRRWMRRRPWITPVTSESKTVSSIVLPPNSTRARARPRPLPSPKRNECSFVWRRLQGRTASLVAGRAGVSAWKPPRRKPSHPPLLLPLPTPPRSFVPLALIPPSTARKPRCSFFYSPNTFPAVGLLVSHVYIPLSPRCFRTYIPNRRRFPHSVQALDFLPLNLPSFAGGYSLDGCPSLLDVVLR